MPAISRAQHRGGGPFAVEPGERDPSEPELGQLPGRRAEPAAAEQPGPAPLDQAVSSGGQAGHAALAGSGAAGLCVSERGQGLRQVRHRDPERGDGQQDCAEQADAEQHRGDGEDHRGTSFRIRIRSRRRGTVIRYRIASDPT